MRPFVLSVFLVFGCFAQMAEVTAEDRPNVLILFSDDQRADTIHALGNDVIRTPNLDRLVRNGVAFENAYIMGGFSPAVCCPSRGMLLSGKTLYHLDPGKSNWDCGRVIPPEHVSFPEVFRQAGYNTLQTGKWHQDTQSYRRMFSLGRSSWLGGTGDHFRQWTFDYTSPGKVPSKEECRAKQAPLKSKPRGKHSSEVYADAVVRFLREYSDSKPFLAYVAFFAPHDQRIAPQEYHDMYKPESMPLPANFLPEHPFDNGELKIRDEKLERWPRTKPAIQRHLADYYAMITHMDAQIGRILEALEETGRDKNTIIVFSSDNGLAVGSHGLMGKQNLYEHSVKVPLIFSGPGIPKDQRRTALCYLIDIYPTICQMAGLTVPESAEGKGLVEAIADSKTSVRDSLCFGYMGVQRALRDDRYKLIQYHVKGKRTTQLFDLRNDPHENTDLADNAEYAGVLKRMETAAIRSRDVLEDLTTRRGKQFWRNYQQ